MLWKQLTMLHVFSDESLKGYAANVYARVSKRSDIFEVISRAKVALLKRVSVPRFELLDALLSERLLKFLHKTLKK